jgi:hypothetical protein
MFMDIWGSQEFTCLQCGRSMKGRTPEEREALRREVETGRKVRLPA